MRVTSAVFLHDYVTLAELAALEPVTIADDGRDRLVVISAAEYGRLIRRDRRVVRPEDLSADELAIIAASDVSQEHDHLNAELDDLPR